MPSDMDWDLKGFFMLLEQSGISVWVRESPSLLAFPTVISLHAVGMGLVAGGNAAVDFSIFCFCQRISLSSLARVVSALRFCFLLYALFRFFALLAFSPITPTEPRFFLQF